LLSEVAPPDLATIEKSLARLLSRLEDVGTSPPAQAFGVSHLLPLLVSAITFEAARRWRKRRFPTSGGLRAWRPRRSALHGNS
jgi:hypothetical protein